MDEKLAKHLSEARFINAVENVLFPSLDQLIANRIELACANFRNGETSFIADIAYVTAIKDLSMQLKQKQRQGNHALAKINET